MNRAPALALCSALVVALSGCGIADPYHGKGLGEPAPASPSRASRAALETFARAWTNWSAPTIAAQRQRLLELATGPLQRELASPRAEPGASEVGAARSSGVVVGILAQPSQRSLVVTAEQLSNSGRAGQSAYHVYVARAEQTTQGWRVAEWRPDTDN
jgi:hypothetical protein